MKKLKKFNSNNYVYFHPSEYGMEILEKYFGDCEYMGKPDEDGYYKLSLWVFVQVFGPHTSITKPSVVVDCEVFFEESKLL